MSQKDSALYSPYIIDGVLQELTPARILSAVTEDSSECVADSSLPAVVDETVDAPVRTVDYDSLSIRDCLDAVRGCGRPFPYSSPCSAARFMLGSALADALWRKGHFRLANLRPEAFWEWNGAPVGSMAAFYRSVESVSSYVDDLGLKLAGYHFRKLGEGPSGLHFTLRLADDDGAGAGDDDSFPPEPFSVGNASLLEGRICPGTLVPDASSWIIYIPFDPSDFRLGGSCLASALGLSGSDPRIEDADYFIDCYEVVREFAEDSVLLSAVSVGKGGLAAALESMCSGGTGAAVDVSGVMRAYGEKSAVRVLFSEIPGVLIQIRDSDFDYVDAELLLQDVAYYPLGHPDLSGAGLRFDFAEKSAIQTILESLLLNAGEKTE